MSYSALNATGLVLGASNAQPVKLTSTASNLLQLQGTGSGVLAKLRGVDQPSDDTDATSRSYVQTYAQTALRGLQMKQAVRLASQININRSGGSLEHSSTVLRWTAPPAGQNMLTYADDYGNTIPVNSSFVVSPTSQWTLGYIYNAHNNQTQFYDDWTPFHFTSSDFGSIGPAFFLRSGGPGPIFGQGLSTQLEICSGGWSQFPGPSARLLLPQSALNANQDIYFLLTYDNSTRTGTMSVATMVNGSLTLVPTPGPATNYPNTNPGVQTGMNGGADGDRLVNWSTLTGASIKNVCFANKIMTMSQVFGPVPASWTTTGIDGTVPVASDRVLQAGQTDAKQNGIYMVSSDGTQLQRPPDFAAGSHAESAYVFANGPGQSNDNKGFLCTNNVATIVDTDAQTWQVYTAAGGLGGLSVNGSSISSSSPVSFNQNVLAPELFTGTLTVQPAQISDSSGTLTFTNTSIAAPQVTTGTLAVAPASLTDSSGAISMGSTNLVTTGNVQASAHKSLCCASEGCSGTSNYRAS